MPSARWATGSSPRSRTATRTPRRSRASASPTTSPGVASRTSTTWSRARGCAAAATPTRSWRGSSARRCARAAASFTSTPGSAPTAPTPTASTSATGCASPPTTSAARWEQRREVHAAHLQQPRHLRGLLAGRAPRALRRGRPDHHGAHRVRRVDRRRGAGRRVDRQDGSRARRRARGDRWPVRRGQGAAGRLLHRRVRDDRAGRGDRRKLARCQALRDGGPRPDDRFGAGDVTSEARVEDLLHRLAPQVLGALVRRYGRFDACEDAVQEALLAAALQWPVEGEPESPSGWLITVAARRLTDEVRSDTARRRREETAAGDVAPGE